MFSIALYRESKKESPHAFYRAMLARFRSQIRQYRQIVKILKERQTAMSEVIELSQSRRCKDLYWAFICGMIILGAVGFTCGGATAVNLIRKDAIKHDVAEYVIVGNEGKTEFRWKERP